MATMSDPITERMARLEGAYEHLATKADLARIETQMAQLETRMAQIQTQMAQLETRMTWRLIGASGAIIAAVTLLQRFF